jgi:hypothetical protein
VYVEALRANQRAESQSKHYLSRINGSLVNPDQKVKMTAWQVSCGIDDQHAVLAKDLSTRIKKYNTDVAKFESELLQRETSAKTHSDNSDDLFEDSDQDRMAFKGNPSDKEDKQDQSLPTPRNDRTSGLELPDNLARESTAEPKDHTMNVQCYREQEGQRLNVPYQKYSGHSVHSFQALPQLPGSPPLAQGYEVELARSVTW